MSWYKKAQQQYLWEDDPQLPNANINRSSVEVSGDIKEDIEDCKNITELQSVLFNYGIKDIDEIIFDKVKEKIWTFEYNNKLYLTDLSFPYPSFEDPKEWLQQIINSGYAWQYIDERDFNKEFWEGVGGETTYYHGTTGEYLDSILREGLSPMDKTRGMSNKFTGEAVFLSDNPDTASSYYDTVLEVNIGNMKRNGYMPQVSIEEDIEESEIANILAYKIGVEDFYYDIEQGMDPGTIILKGTIPPQYIKVMYSKGIT